MMFAPARGRRRRADAEEAERRFRENGVGKDEGQLDDQGSETIWQHVLDDDVHVAGTADPRGLQILHLANDQHGGTHDPRRPRHISNCERHHDTAGLCAECRADTDGQQDRGERHQRVHQSHDVRIERAKISRQDADHGAEHA